MSAKSTDESLEMYEKIEKESHKRKKRREALFLEDNIYNRAEEFIKKYPYVDSFLSSAQGYEVLTKFMVEFSKLERKL